MNEGVEKYFCVPFLSKSLPLSCVKIGHKHLHYIRLYLSYTQVIDNEAVTDFENNADPGVVFYFFI